MTDREKEILEAIKKMGLFRTNYPQNEVSASGIMTPITALTKGLSC